MRSILRSRDQILDGRASGAKAGGPSFAFRNRVLRALWKASWLIFARWTPPQLYLWRSALLNLFGAKVHPTARVYSSAQIWFPPNLEMGPSSALGPRAICYCMAKVTIGPRAVVSQGAHLCAGTHDIDDPDFQLIAHPIDIGEGAWVAAEAFVGPGVVIGAGAVLGARGVTFKNVPDWEVHAGNPAKFVKFRKHCDKI